MRRPAAALAASLLVLTGCSVGGSGGGSGDGADTGRPAGQGVTASRPLPDVTLQPLSGGKPVDLGSLKGPTVVNLWASWCTPCRRELPHYQAFAQQYAGKVDVLGIDFQETRPDAARQLARQTGVTYPLVTDPDGRLRAIGLPEVVLVDADGKVAFRQYVVIDSVAQLEDLVRKHLGVAG